MPKKTYIKVNGTWKEVTNIWKKVSNIWQDQVMSWKNVQTTWKQCMNYSPYNIFIGTYPSGYILKSNNDGLSFVNDGSVGLGVPQCWYQLANGDLLYGTDIGYVVNHTKGTSVKASNYSIADINQSDDPSIRIIIGDRNGDIYMSDDNAVSFFAIGINHGIINAVDMYSSANWTIYTSVGIYVSNVLKQAGNFKCFCYSLGGGQFAGDASGHIWQSLDSGDTWTDLGLKTSGAAINILYLEDMITGRIFFMTSNGYVKYTVDNFATVVQTDYNYSNPHAFISLGDGILMDVWTNGINRCTNNGIVTPPNQQWAWEPNSGFSVINLIILVPGEIEFGYGIIKKV